MSYLHYQCKPDLNCCSYQENKKPDRQKEEKKPVGKLQRRYIDLFIVIQHTLNKTIYRLLVTQKK